MICDKESGMSKLKDALLSAQHGDKRLSSRDWILDIDDEDAYTIQREVEKEDRTLIAGYKISLTSNKTQKMFNSSSPLFGTEKANKIFQAPVILSKNTMNEPLIEVELAFIAQTTITNEMSDKEIMQSVTIAGAAELPDSRFLSWWPKLSKTLIIADNAVAGMLVYGEDKKIESAEMLNNINATLSLNGLVIATGNSSEVLGNPLVAVRWLLNKLKEFNEVISPDQIISSGTFFVPPHLEQGYYTVEFDTDLITDFSFSVR
ncbi:2-keto-4-pentenoate hydratase [Leuconostoc citreum]|uniref:2-keto-4-pentenoate hydratase n=1 Tax=Leuconostoc citreum TaxID=33964 RepID=UPI0020A21685|nr:2-keto-4-pentenoate hydratase [Leuconostoc citreum]MCP1275764.1 2-keto-4-pentenoate hydratase [Leuconostoc citreum]